MRVQTASVYVSGSEPPEEMLAPGKLRLRSVKKPFEEEVKKLRWLRKFPWGFRVGMPMTVPLKVPDATVVLSWEKTRWTTATGLSSSPWIDAESDSLGPVCAVSCVPRATKMGRKYDNPPCPAPGESQNLETVLAGTSSTSREDMTGKPWRMSPVSIVLDDPAAAKPRSNASRWRHSVDFILPDLPG